MPDLTRVLVLNVDKSQFMSATRAADILHQGTHKSSLRGGQHGYYVLTPLSDKRMSGPGDRKKRIRAGQRYYKGV